MSSWKRMQSPLNESLENNSKRIKIHVDKEDKLNSLFDQDSFNLSAFEHVEQDACALKLDLREWQRCYVKDVYRKYDEFALILKVRKLNHKEEEQDAVATCYLQGPWYHTKIIINDVVSLKAEWDHHLRAFKIDKDRGFCVTNPDTLISGTTVVGSLFCRRKAVIQERFRGIDANNKVFSEGEYVIVSTEQRLAVAGGFVRNLTSTSITVTLERNLLKKYKQEIFIIDKHESQSGNIFNFTNLGLLLDDTERSETLRKIIITKETPIYQKVLPKAIATEGSDIMKQLNAAQRTAVLKALTTHSYMLIKGLPGTGKTQTLVAIVRLLMLLGKSVLITSHTNSAVDNLLIRLKAYKIPFIRLGSSARIHNQLEAHSESHLTVNCKTETELSKVYNAYQIVGVTCLGSAHAIFQHRHFDFCIVDEATQVMQPTVLRPLFFCQRFILVGDPDQLPPLIRSPLAKLKGADESLFQHLDCKEATSVLNLQYRMNKTITKLANELTYKGLLQCASEKVKTSVMYKKIDPLRVKEKWLQRVLQTHVDQSVFILDTLDCSERSYNFAKSKHNDTCLLIETTYNENQLHCGTGIESAKSPKRLSKYTNYCEAAIVFKIIKVLLQFQYDPQRIGVIAPYRAQVELLKNLALQHHEFYQASAQDKPHLLDFTSVEINTVDQYQGRDKDIVIYSCSRTGSGTCKTAERNRDSEILEDKRRLTVAITRSKHKLIIVGDTSCVQQYTPFQKLFQHIPSFCKLKLENERLGFQWSVLMEELSTVIKAT